MNSLKIVLKNLININKPNIRIRYECTKCGAFSLNPSI